ncbi:MAG: hypothetical protein ACJ8J0_24250 [Longimicrobiaceae bacterium]
MSEAWTPAARPRPLAFAPPPREPRPQPLVQWLVIFLLLCQVTLLVPGIGSGRMLVRVAAFGMSLFLLAAVRGKALRRHPAFNLAVLTVMAIAVALANPLTTNLVAGGAQAALYVAVLAPLFWVSRLSPDTRALRQTVTILWGFHTLSAALGILQVYAPGSFQPPVSSIILSKGPGYINSLMITTANGVKVFRPMGLTDIPGGASVSGLYAVLFGTGFFLTRRDPWSIGASVLSMGIGIACLSLSQVRSVLVMTGIAVVVVCGVLAWRRDFVRLKMLGGVAVAAAVGGYGVAHSLAGGAVQRRMSSLSSAPAGSVYYRERGHFLADAVERLLPEAPLGRGLGHWGMTATYFGDPDDPNGIWVEIQWAGWIVDGGAPLTLLYALALLVAIWSAFRVARAPPPPSAPDLPFWGVIVFAHGIATFAFTFSFPVFLSQPGMEFWLLNATLLAAAARAARRPAQLPAAEAVA